MNLDKVWKVSLSSNKLQLTFLNDKIPFVLIDNNDWDLIFIKLILENKNNLLQLQGCSFFKIKWY
jgi:hypothetical protein